MTQKNKKKKAFAANIEKRIEKTDTPLVVQSDKTPIDPVSKQNKKNASDIQNISSTPHTSLWRSFIFFLVILAVIGGFIYISLPFSDLARTSPRQVVIRVPEKKVETPIVNTIEVHDTLALDECQKQKDQITFALDQNNQKLESLIFENENLKKSQEQKEIQLSTTIRLLNALSTGRPFRYELDMLLKQSPLNAFALRIQQDFENFSYRGLPTSNQVQQAFYRSLELTEDSFYMPQKDSSWQAQIALFFKTLIRVRPLHLENKQLSGIDWLYKAQAQIDKNDIAGALTSVQKLGTEQKKLMSSFIQAATLHLKLNDILNQY